MPYGTDGYVITKIQLESQSINQTSFQHSNILNIILKGHTFTRLMEDVELFIVFSGYYILPTSTNQM